MAFPLLRKEVDVTGIFDSTFNQVFADARPLKASVNETAQLMRHPIEDKREIADHKVFNLVEIELPFLINSEEFRNVFQSMKKGYLENTLYTIQTRVDTYQNMSLESIPYEESIEVQDGITLIAKFIETLFEEPIVRYIPTPTRPQDASKVNRGTQQTQETNEAKRESILSRVF